MRTIKYIVVHATGGSQRTTIKELMMEFARLDWKAPGYHYVVHVDGRITQLLGEEKVSCDLLEKSYFCSITNNISQHVRGVYPPTAVLGGVIRLDCANLTCPYQMFKPHLAANYSGGLVLAERFCVHNTHYRAITRHPYVRVHAVRVIVTSNSTQRSAKRTPLRLFCAIYLLTEFLTTSIRSIGHASMSPTAMLRSVGTTGFFSAIITLILNLVAG